MKPFGPHQIDASDTATDGTYGLEVVAGKVVALTPGGGATDASSVTFTPTGNIAATNVQAALAEVDTEKVGQGVEQFRTGARALPPYPHVKLQSSDPDLDGMVIWTQKAGGDSTDVNVDGAVMVKHAKGYLDTEGYADTFQLYTLAGSKGTIVGNNDYVGSGATPYAPPADATPKGFIRFELGPIWPLSERARLNNEGDLILGWTIRTTGSRYTQSGTTVTRSSGTGTFTPNDVGGYLMWTGDRAGGWCDRIVGYIDATHVTVETSRTVAAEDAEVRIPKVLIRHDGTVETGAGMVVTQAHGQTGPLFKIQNANGATLFAVDADGTVTGTPSGTTSGEVLMQDGATGPPVPLENEDRDDWLYEG